MIRHVVLLTFGPEATPERVRALQDGLAELPGLIPEIRAYTSGSDLELREGNADLAIVAEFDDVEAYRAYSAHPAHQRLIEDLLTPIVASRAAAQFLVDG